MSSPTAVQGQLFETASTLNKKVYRQFSVKVLSLTIAFKAFFNGFTRDSLTPLIEGLDGEFKIHFMLLPHIFFLFLPSLIDLGKFSSCSWL